MPLPPLETTRYDVDDHGIATITLSRRTSSTPTTGRCASSSAPCSTRPTRMMR